MRRAVFTRCLLSCAVLALCSAPARAAIPEGSPQAADLRRALTLLNVAAEEYREGVVGGQVVIAEEYAQASGMLSEAQSRLRGVAPDAAAPLAADFERAQAAIAAKQPTDQVRGMLDGLRAAITAATGVSEPVFPPAAPSASRGRALFAEHCAGCHGARADGVGPNAARLDPKPANFTDAQFMRGETPFDFFHVISIGKGTSAMPAWGDVLTLQDRWDLVSYLWTVSATPHVYAEGQGVYLSACAGCHGAAGDGSGEYRAALRAPAPSLADPATLARLSDTEMLALVRDGVPGSPMPGFAGRLSDAQLSAAVTYVRLLSLGGDDGSHVVAADSGEAARFAGLLKLLGGEYQKAMPPGQAPVAQELTESEILLEQVQRQAPRVLTALAAQDATAAAQLGADVEQLARVVTQRGPAADAARASTAAAQILEARFPAAATAPGTPPDALAEARRLLAEALAAYQRGDARAVYTVSDAYFLFDPLEKPLGLSDAALARRLEGQFAELRGVMAKPGHAAEAAALVASLDSGLETARQVLAPRASRLDLVLQSAFIILREGFEVVLIVGALLAYARKSGNPALRAPILWGTAAGFVGSLLSAWALLRLVTAAGATAEVIEGATMLLASGVLFFVSYWLISKAEAERWQRYIQSKVKSAIATGNLFALGSAAFLAVYREGTETVLFYRALLGEAGDSLAPVLAGMAIGSLGLALFYAAYMRLGQRLPMRQFFLVTGGLLYYLAVVFAGKGVAELQAGGVVPTTLLAWAPRIELLGVFPTLETMLAQAVLVACALYAAAITWRRNRSDRAVTLEASHGAKL
ncbi:MAG: c-type cytochrome [Deltaproteobacteria bacterium]|nr:c-type cytochrome [Deltaproteobacteria bacterium]